MPCTGLQPLVDALSSGDRILRAAGMEPAALLLAGTAFFPVGRGMTAPDDCCLRNKPVMVLGQDFGTVAYLEQRLQKGRDGEADGATWRELLNLLPKAGIPLSDCFFTNAYMGLRQEGPMVGALPASKDRNGAYRRWCDHFWLLQAREQQPALVVALGNVPTRFLSGLFPEALGAWDTPASYTALLDSGKPLLPFTLDERPCLAVTIPHPSFLHANAGRCRWRGESGRRALAVLLEEAYRRATALPS